MSYDWAFLPMRSSNDLLGDPAALRERLATDSYLYFEQLLPRDDVLEVREKMTDALVEAGWIRGGPAKMDAQAIRPVVREGEDDFFPALKAVQKIQKLHELAHHPDLLAMMRQVRGETVFPHPLKITRLIFPEFEAVSTPPHQDYPNNQGTPDLTATWIPVGDIPAMLGGLAILRGSHRWGPLPLQTHLGAGNRAAIVPLDMLEECRWVTTDYAVGDVLVFPSLTVHASRHNLAPGRMRLSIDFRYQLEGEALTPVCLEPHFQQFGWEEVYADWDDDTYQYYWHDLDYQVDEFEDLPVAVVRDEDDQIGEYLTQEHRSTLRARAREVGS